MGLAIAEQFLQAGAHVAIAARDPAELAKAKRQLLVSMPQAKAPTILEVVCDITEPSSIETAVETVQHALGSIDVLVNNAGIMAVAPLLNQSERHFEEAMDTNFYGAMHTTFAILPGIFNLRTHR